MAMMPPLLLGADGLPIDRSRLKQEQAAPGIASIRQVISGHPSKGITPERLARLMLEAEQGNATAYLELLEDIEEKEPHYLGVLGKRKRAVAQLDMVVSAASNSADDQKAADLIKRVLDRDELEEELLDLLDALGKGYAVAEICWDTRNGQWLPRELKWRDPRWFAFDLFDGVTLRLRTNEGLVDLDPYKFIVHIAKAKSGIPIRGGLTRCIAWLYLFKNFDLKSWVTFTEAFGHPLRVGKYGLGASKEDKAKLLDAVRNIAQDAAAIIPEGTLIEFIEAKITGNIALFEGLAKYIDQQISKAVLGNTGTTDAIAGGHAVGRTHREVERDIERSDAKSLAGTLNRTLVRAVIDLNMGPREVYPRIRFDVEDDEDVQLFSTAVGAMVDRGLRVGQSVIRQRLRIPDPEPDDELLTPAPSGAGAGKVAPSAPEATRANAIAAALPSSAVEADAIDALIAEQLGDWQPMVKPVLDAVRELRQRCGSDEEALRRLPEVVRSMNVNPLADALSRSMFAAYLAGLSGADLGGA